MSGTMTLAHGMEEVRGSNPLSSTQKVAGQEASPPLDDDSPAEIPMGVRR